MIKTKYVLPASIVLLSTTISACSNHQTPPANSEYAITATYHSVRNDLNPKLSQGLKFKIGLPREVSSGGSSHYTLLGQEVALICSSKTDCAQSSNLASITYTIRPDEKGLVLQGTFNNEMGSYTESKGSAGVLRLSINSGATLYKEGSHTQDFRLPIVPGEKITMTGPLEDKLTIVVE